MKTVPSNLLLCAASIFAAVLTWLTPAHGNEGAIPNTFNVQGRVLSGTGAPINERGQFKFAISSTNGTVLWSNDGSTNGSPTNAITLQVSDGFYSVQLGDRNVANMRELPAGLFTNGNVRLHTWYKSSTDSSFNLLQPELPIVPVPMALVAREVPNGSITADKLHQSLGLISDSLGKVHQATEWDAIPRKIPGVFRLSTSSDKPDQTFAPILVELALTLHTNVHTNGRALVLPTKSYITVRRPLQLPSAWLTYFNLPNFRRSFSPTIELEYHNSSPAKLELDEWGARSYGFVRSHTGLIYEELSIWVTNPRRTAIQAPSPPPVLTVTNWEARLLFAGAGLNVSFEMIEFPKLYKLPALSRDLGGFDDLAAPVTGSDPIKVMHDFKHGDVVRWLAVNQGRTNSVPLPIRHNLVLKFTSGEMQCLLSIPSAVVAGYSHRLGKDLEPREIVEIQGYNELLPR